MRSGNRRRSDAWHTFGLMFHPQPGGSIRSAIAAAVTRGTRMTSRLQRIHQNRDRRLRDAGKTGRSFRRAHGRRPEQLTPYEAQLPRA
jgi:hypothetical protein